MLQVSIRAGRHEMIRYILEHAPSAHVNWSHPINNKHQYTSMGETDGCTNLADAVRLHEPLSVAEMTTAKGFDLDRHYDPKFTLWKVAIEHHEVEIIEHLCVAHSWDISMRTYQRTGLDEEAPTLLKNYSPDLLTIELEFDNSPLVCAASIAGVPADGEAMKFLLAEYHIGVTNECVSLTPPSHARGRMRCMRQAGRQVGR